MLAATGRRSRSAQALPALQVDTPGDVTGGHGGKLVLHGTVILFSPRHARC